MKQDKKKIARETFPFRFTTTLRILAYAALLLCAVAVTVSVFGIIREGIDGIYGVLRYPFLIAVSLFGIALIISLLIRSQYVIEGTTLITQFGFVKSKADIKKITSIVQDTETNKLSVYVGEEYSVATLPKSETEKFVRALLKVNPDIDYSFTVTENKPQNEDKN